MRKKRLLEQARKYLRKEVDVAVAEGKKAIADVRSLAAMAGVSIGTMNKAVREMKESGKLLCIPGAGIYLAQIAGESAIRLPPRRCAARPAKNCHPVWLEVYIKIFQRIQQGHSPPGTALPSSKTLSEDLGVSYPTLRKVYDELRTKGIIERYRRKFRVVAPASRAFHHSLVLLVGGLSPDGIGILDFPRIAHDLRAIEHECVRRGVNLIVVIQNMKDRDYGFFLNGVRINLNGRFMDRNKILGCIICNYNIDDAASMTTYRHTRNLQAPVVVYDIAGGEQNMLSTGRAFPMVRNEALSDTCGNAIGRYLFSLGHRDIAYIAPQAFWWSQPRLNGLKKAADACAHAITIHECIETAPMPPVESEVQYLNVIVPAVRTALSGLNDPFPALLIKVLSARNLEIRTLVVQEQRYALDRICFEKALGLRRVSAWVCQNDSTALNALRFLREHGIGVPQEISVAGFDDTAESCERRLTSYNFNSDTVARVLVSTVLKAPSYLMVRTNKKTFDIQGFIVERNTTAPLRQAR